MERNAVEASASRTQLEQTEALAALCSGGVAREPFEHLSAGTATAAFGAALVDRIDVRGSNGSVRVNGLLLMNPGKLDAQQDVGYGSLVTLPLGTVTAGGTVAAAPPLTAPATTASDAWNAARAAGGLTYDLRADGTIRDGSGAVVNSPPLPWNGWLYGAAAWTHLGGDFAPGGAPATFGSPLTIAVAGGSNASAAFISNESVTIAVAATLTPVGGVSVFADKDVLIAGTGIALGTAASPGYIVAGEQIGIVAVPLVGTIAIHGSVVAKNAGAVSLVVLANLVSGKVTITEDAPSPFILGKPRLKTTLAYETLAGPSLPLPVDASEGSLGVYR